MAVPERWGQGMSSTAGGPEVSPFYVSAYIRVPSWSLQIGVGSAPYRAVLLQISPSEVRVPPQHSQGWHLAWLYPRCKKDQRINSRLLPRVPTSPAATARGRWRWPSTKILPISPLPSPHKMHRQLHDQPAAKKPPAITPSLGSNLGRLRGAQPPPSASSWRIGRPRAWFWRRFFWWSPVWFGSLPARACG